ncbi:MAG: hypothetical protein NT140_01350 [Deltaproteobacteria bacterium]|nr:hypothetical protein [Deltaproteobacteria bacterium]
MKVFNTVTGITGIASFIFLLFPDSLSEVLKLGTTRLIVLCIFIICATTLIHSLIAFIIMRVKSSSGSVMAKKTPVEIIRRPEGHHYFVQDGICRHIPDPPTYEYLGMFLGFTWLDARTMLFDDIKKKYSIGEPLPSIESFFPK